MDNQQPSVKQGKNALKYKIKEGERYGNYIADKEIVTKIKTGIERKWLAHHIYDNAKIILARPSYLITIKNNYQNCLNSKNYQKGLWNYLYRVNKTGANKRNHKHSLSFDDFKEISTQNCYYCGDVPKEVTPELIKQRGNLSEPIIKYNGIDRIDPKLGYVKENCVPCCSTCNYMKHVLTKEDFFNKIKQIHNFQKFNEGSTTSHCDVAPSGGEMGETVIDNTIG